MTERLFPRSAITSYAFASPAEQWRRRGFFGSFVDALHRSRKQQAERVFRQWRHLNLSTNIEQDNVR